MVLGSTAPKGPSIVTDILTKNKGLIIALIIILAFIFLLQWVKKINQKLSGI